MADPTDFLTITQAAELVGVSRRRVQQLLEEGHLAVATYYGRTAFLRRADVERLAREGWPGRRRGPAARDRP